MNKALLKWLFDSYCFLKNKKTAYINVFSSEDVLVIWKKILGVASEDRADLFSAIKQYRNMVESFTRIHNVGWIFHGSLFPREDGAILSASFHEYDESSRGYKYVYSRNVLP